MTIERLKNPSAGELDALTDLWEASVRATHDFLAPEDIVFFRQMVRQEALRGVELHVIRKPAARRLKPEHPQDRRAGTSSGHPARQENPPTWRAWTRTGCSGDSLRSQVSTAICSKCSSLRRKRAAKEWAGNWWNISSANAGIRRVDVNEQNVQAAGFYARLGFRVTGRDATDPSGRPYPILHLSLGETPQRIVPIPNLQTDRVDVDFEPEPTGDEGK